METLLVLNINPELEEDLVDYLLSLPCVGGFTSYQVRGHGNHRGMNVAEQVVGRRKRLQIEIIMQVADVQELLDGLANSVGLGIEYWQQPISRRGKIQ